MEKPRPGWGLSSPTSVRVLCLRSTLPSSPGERLCLHSTPEHRRRAQAPGGALVLLGGREGHTWAVRPYCALDLSPSTWLTHLILSRPLPSVAAGITLNPQRRKLRPECCRDLPEAHRGSRWLARIRTQVQLTPEPSRSILRMLPGAGRSKRPGVRDAHTPQGAGWHPSPRHHVSRGGEAPGWRKAGPSASAAPARALPASSPSRWAAPRQGPLPPLTLQSLWPRKNASLYLLDGPSL